MINGFCSEYLKNLKIDNTINGVIKKGSINFPRDITTPIIMVGPGTGIAPFMSYIENRNKTWNNNNKNIEKTNTILFFGSCYEKKEYYFKEYL